VPSFEVPLTPGEEVMLREAKDFGLEQSSFELISRLPASGSSSEGDLRSRLLDGCLARLIHARLDRLWTQPSSPLGASPALDLMSDSSEGRFAAFSIRARAKPGQLRAAIAVVGVELERVLQHGFTEKELESARTQGARSLKRAWDELSIQGETARLVQLFLSGEGRTSPEQAAAIGQRLLGGIDLSAVRARAAEWLRNSRRSLLALRAPGDSSLASEQDLQALMREMSTRVLEPYRDDGPLPLLAAPPDPAKIVGAEEMAALELRIWTLQNGAKLAFKPVRSGPDRVLLRAVSPGGRAHAAPLHYDSARFAERVVLDSGVGAHDIGALFRLLEGTRVQVEPWLSDDFEGFRGSSAAAELELMLQLVYLYVTSPRADPREFELFRASLREPPDPGRSFSPAISAALYPGNPRFARPNPDALDLGEMLRFYRDRLGNVGDFTFVIVGDIAEAELRTLVERYVASLPGSPRSDRRPALKDERRSGITRVRWSGRKGRDSTVLLEFHGPAEPSARARSDLDALALQLEAELFEEVRQQRGGSYSLGVSTQWSADTYTLTIRFDCLPVDVGALQEVTWEVIGRLTQARASAAAVEALQARLRERYAKAMVSTEFWATELERAYAHGRPPEEILSLPDSSSRLTRESLAAAARRYLPRDRYLDAVWSPD
jgi:zinc protease